MSLRDRVPKVSKDLWEGCQVEVHEPGQPVRRGRIAHPPFKYTAIVDFGKSSGKRGLWHVGHAYIHKIIKPVRGD